MRKIEINAVIFDMDGVLFDTERLGRQLLAAAGKEIGIADIAQEYVGFMGLSHQDTKRRMERLWGRREAAELLVRYEESLRAYYETHQAPLKPGVRELLGYLRENMYQMAVASSSPARRVLQNLEDAEIAGYFEVIVAGDQVTYAKPDPEIYLTACSRLRIPPGQCLVIEDSLNGLKAAWRAGCETVFVRDLWEPDGQAEEFIHHRREDLGGVIELLGKYDLMAEGTV